MFVRVTLFRSVDGKVDASGRVDEKVDASDGALYPYGLSKWFQTHESISIREAMALFGLSKSGAHKRLKELVDAKTLIMLGDSKASRYIPLRANASERTTI